MRLIPCRDCGEALTADARGCPRCARNIEAERTLARILSLASALIALVCLSGLIYIFMSKH